MAKFTRQHGKNSCRNEKTRAVMAKTRADMAKLRADMKNRTDIEKNVPTWKKHAPTNVRADMPKCTPTDTAEIISRGEFSPGRRSRDSAILSLQSPEVQQAFLLSIFSI